MTPADPMDALLDAFDTPAFDAVAAVPVADQSDGHPDEDAAVERVLAALAAERAPAPSRRRRLLPGLALAAGIALAFLLGRTTMPDHGTTTLLLPESPLVLVGDPIHPPKDATEGASVLPASTTFGEGLEILPGARVERRGPTGVLRDGTIRFVRRDGVDPGIGRVRFATSGLLATPVGTVFVASTREGVDGIAVTEGRVILEDRDGAPLAEVRAGESVLVVRGAGGLHVERLEGRDLLEIATSDHDLSPETLSAFALSLRLAALPPEQRAALESFQAPPPQGDPQ